MADVHVRTWQSAYEHVFGAERLATLDAEARRPRWEQLLRDDARSAFVAEQDGCVVGFVTVGESRDPGADGELMGIYAAPEAWGSGAGPELMAAGLEELRARGHRDAILWVLEDNPRARRFYEREGWTLDGAEKRDEFLGVEVAEVRYRITL